MHAAPQSRLRIRVNRREYPPVYAWARPVFESFVPFPWRTAITENSNYRWSLLQNVVHMKRVVSNSTVVWALVVCGGIFLLGGVLLAVALGQDDLHQP